MGKPLGNVKGNINFISTMKIDIECKGKYQTNNVLYLFVKQSQSLQSSKKKISVILKIRDLVLQSWLIG